MTEYCQYCQQPIGVYPPPCSVPGHGKAGHHQDCCPSVITIARNT